MPLIDSPRDSTEELLERGIASIYSAFFRMRKAEEYQREYESICILQNMLSQDKLNLLSKHSDKINLGVI